MRIMPLLGTVRFGCKFFRHAHGSLLAKTRTTLRYLPLYYYHTSIKAHSIASNLAEFDRKTR